MILDGPKRSLRKFARMMYIYALSAMPFSLRLRLDHIRRTKKIASEREPRTHSERMLRRALRDRSTVLAQLSSKYEMKELVRERSRAKINVPRTIWTGSRAALIGAYAKLELPKKWVLKPNNLGGGLVLMGNPATTISDVRRFLGQCETERRRFRKFAPVGWRGSRGGYLIEEQVGALASSLVDYKFHVFGGKAKLVSVYSERFGKMSKVHFRLPLSPLFAIGEGPRYFPEGALDHLAEAIQLSEILAFDLEYVRVDLYIDSGQIWLGEISPFGAFEGLCSRPELDRELGSYWRLAHGPELDSRSPIRER